MSYDWRWFLLILFSIMHAMREENKLSFFRSLLT
jgi:hypothetical protein